MNRTVSLALALVLLVLAVLLSLAILDAADVAALRTTGVRMVSVIVVAAAAVVGIGALLRRK